MPSYSNVQAAGLLVYKKLEERIMYLLLQTSYGKHHWTPPKGHVDPNEDTLAAAMRETEEEAGYAKGDLTLDQNFKTSITYFDSTKKSDKVVHFWLARLSNLEKNVRLSEEHQAFRWAELEEARQLANFPTLDKLLVDAEAFIRTQA